MLIDGEEHLHGEVRINRIKFKTYEAYKYDMSMTSDTYDVARRLSTMMATYMFRRAVFEVQYMGMFVCSECEGERCGACHSKAYCSHVACSPCVTR